MSEPAPALQIDQDLRFERREWVAQRALWSLLLFIPVAALMGLAGVPGPLARATAGGSGLEPSVEYPRIARNGSTVELAVTFSAPSQGPIELWVSHAYLDAFQIERVTPEPRAERSEGARLVLEIDAPAQRTTGVVVHLRPAHAGLARGRLGLGGDDGVELRTLILP